MLFQHLIISLPFPQQGQFSIKSASIFSLIPIFTQALFPLVFFQHLLILKLFPQQEQFWIQFINSSKISFFPSSIPKTSSELPTPSKQNAVVILALKQVLQSIQICNSYPFLSASDYFLGVLFQNLVILPIFTARIILNQTFLHLLPIFTQLEPFNHVYFQHLIIL